MLQDARRQFMLVLCLCLLSCQGGQSAPAISAGQQSAPLGQQPADNFAARDIFLEYNLPPLRDQAQDALRRQERQDQVLVRASLLSLNRSAATAAWLHAGEVESREVAYADIPVPMKPTVFTGSTASELNALLALASTHYVQVTSASIHIDVPILIQRSDLVIDFNQATLESGNNGPFLLKVVGSESIRITGGSFTGHGWAVLVERSRKVSISRSVVRNATGGVLITGSQDVLVRDGTFQSLQEAGILLHGDTHRVALLQNRINGNLGNSNWHAGVVITDRNADLGVDPRGMMREDNYGVREQPIATRLAVPTGNVIAFNRIQGNASSGIYSDGGSANVFAQNSIEGNAKEGFCLDNGSTANVVVFNVIRGNGKRWGKSDADLRRDFVAGLGRLPDGTSPAKLPGLSIDNAAYNQVLYNNIHENFGGGVKMVRTAFYNVVGMNTLVDNNEGRNHLFHFFAIELGSAGADVKVPDLDFRPSRGNEIFGNTIRGKHYAGIFFADGSDSNVVFDNAIFGATDWAMESVRIQPNQSFNNLSNLRCRNISTGLDRNLLELGSAHAP